MSKKGKEVTTKEAEVTTALNNASLAGSEEADAGDIIVPRILLMQGTSKLVPDTFQQGDIIQSLDEERLGGRGEPVEIVPFALKKTWEEFEKGDESKWIGSYAWNASNNDLEWQFVNENGAECFRQRQYTFYCFIASEMGAFPIPCLIGFRSSSGFKEGKKIASHFSVMKGQNLPGHNVAWSIDSATVKDGGKSFQKFAVKKVRETTAKEIEVCNKWLGIISNAGTNIKEHSENEATSTKEATAKKEEFVPDEGHVPF